MLDPKAIVSHLQSQDVEFFAGVPDSLLQPFCACVDDVLPSGQHVITANEGGAIALASGYHLATNKLPVVYMQNSGLGNAVNPLLSLADPEVYAIPMLLFVGWRGEPGTKDEPQHIKQGPVTPTMLEAMGIAYEVLPEETESALKVIDASIKETIKTQTPIVLLVRKDTFSKYTATSTPPANDSISNMTREEAVEIIIDKLPPETAFVGTTGKLSRELFELREKRGESHDRDFLTVGSMGHASQISLGIAEFSKAKLVVCLDGDGAAFMHLGGLATIGQRKPHNLIHIIINNGVHESVGGQVVTGTADFVSVAKALGYAGAERVDSVEALTKVLNNLERELKPFLIDCVVKAGSRSDLGRPTSSPRENRIQFEKFIR